MAILLPGTSATNKNLRASTILHSSLGKSLFALGVLGLVLVTQPNKSEAADLTWNPLDTTGTNLGGAGTWGVADNWYDGSNPATWTAGDSAFFTGGGGVVTVDLDQTVGGINFDASGFSLTGSGVLQLNDGIINAADSVTALIQTEINIGTSTLFLNSVGSGELTIGDISGGGVIEVGGGSVILTGDALVSALIIRAGAFSTAGGLDSGAAVQNEGLLEVSGNQTVASLDGNGLVSISGAILTIGGGEIGGIISGDGGLATTGDVVLTAANTFSGITTVSDGTLDLVLDQLSPELSIPLFIEYAQICDFVFWCGYNSI